MGFFDLFRKKKRYVSKFTMGGEKSYHLGKDGDHWVVFTQDPSGNQKLLYRSRKTGQEGHEQAFGKLDSLHKMDERKAADKMQVHKHGGHKHMHKFTKR